MWPRDAITRVRKAQFVSNDNKWPTKEGDYEIYWFVTINFLLDFPQSNGGLSKNISYQEGRFFQNRF